MVIDHSSPKFPPPAGRFLLFTTKVRNSALLIKDYPIFFLDAANLEFQVRFRSVPGPFQRIGVSWDLLRNCEVIELFHILIYEEKDIILKEFYINVANFL